MARGGAKATLRRNAIPGLYSAREEAWIEAMVDGASIPAACEVSGVPLQTGKKWWEGKQRPDVRAEVDRRLAQLREINEEIRVQRMLESANEQATSRASIIDHTLEFLNMAKEEMNVQGGMKCVEMLAKLGGHLVQKQEVKIEEIEAFEIDPDTLNEEEFEKWAAYEELREAKKASGS